MIVIVDYGVGNLASIRNMFKKVGVEAVISSSPSDVATATKLVLPGVGAFDAAMQQLNRSGVREPLEQRVLADHVPILGLCLGMQLLTEGSEEGSMSGLGWIAATSRRFRFDGASATLKVPHMGWNRVHTRAGKSLVAALPAESRFYFVHSYHLSCRNEDDVAATTHYGYDFPSVIQRDHIMGTQFHPEKSHRFGMILLQTFAEL